MFVRWMIAVSLTCGFALASFAQDTPKPTSGKDGVKERTEKRKYAVTIAGKKLDYEVVTGTQILKEEDGKPTASMFYTAYLLPDADRTKRPITFCFNGGPGSSSVWLHLGAFGPRRVLLSDQGEALPPPAKLVANEFSILDRTDLVFIDPVSTGFSRAADEKDAKKFHGVEEDLQSVGEFIRLYCTRQQRWASPKYLAGESYGTTRASALVGYLQDRHGMSFNGVILVSAVLNFQTLRFEEGNDLPYILYLPSYAATAWYHKKVNFSKKLPDLIREVEKFSLEDYTVALQKGNRLTPIEQRSIAEKIAGYTGLSTEYVLRSNLRVSASRFFRELLRDRGQAVGRFDSRLLLKDGEDVSERGGMDPSYAAVQGPYSTALNDYLRRELGFESDLPYEILTGRVQPWNYGSAANGRYLNVAPRLRSAMIENPHLRLFIASGYYDLATPYFATDHTFDHLGGTRELSTRVTTKYYEAGHMMYIHKPSLQQLREDLVKFYDAIQP